MTKTVVDETALSLLDRQDRIRDENIERMEQARQKARRARRRQELIGLGIQGGIKVANAVLAERSDNFINKEWDMASRAKYKAAVSARDDTQALWTNIRNTHDSSADWKLDQLKEDAFEYYKRIQPNWDGKLNPEAVRKLKEEAEKWGTNFDLQHQKSFEIEDYDKYAAGLQKKFGRPKDIGSWVTRGIVDRFGGMSLAEGRASRKEALQKEIEGFDEKYGSFYDSVADRTGSSEDALEIVRAYAANAREEVLKFKVESDGYLWQEKRGIDGKRTYRKTDQFVGRDAKIQDYGYNGSGIMLYQLDDQGNWNASVLKKAIDRPQSAEQRKEAVNEAIRQLYASPDYSNLGSDLERYNKLRKENEPLFLKGITGNSPLLKQFFDNQTTTLKNAGISGGRPVLINAIEAQYETLQGADGEFDPNSPIIQALEKAGFKDKNSQQAQLELMRRFGQDGRKDDTSNYNLQVVQDVVDTIKNDQSGKINHVSLIADAMVERSKQLIELKDSAPWWWSNDLIVYQGSRNNQEVDELRQTNTINRSKEVSSINERGTVSLGKKPAARLLEDFNKAKENSNEEALKFIEDFRSKYNERAQRDGLTATLELPAEIEAFEKNNAQQINSNLAKEKNDKQEDDSNDKLIAAAVGTQYEPLSPSELNELSPDTQKKLLEDHKRKQDAERLGEDVVKAGKIVGRAAVRAGEMAVEGVKSSIQLQKDINNLTPKQKEKYDLFVRDGKTYQEAYDLAIKG